MECGRGICSADILDQCSYVFGEGCKTANVLEGLSGLDIC